MWGGREVLEICSLGKKRLSQHENLAQIKVEEMLEKKHFVISLNENWNYSHVLVRLPGADNYPLTHVHKH